MRRPGVFPDVSNPPLYSILLGIFFMLFGESHVAIVICGTILLVGTAVMVYSWGREATGPWAAWWQGSCSSPNPLALYEAAVS
jgi:4-amino-4-deoxy-L-arabinose transferase-like glycosyltransferase